MCAAPARRPENKTAILACLPPGIDRRRPSTRGTRRPPPTPAWGRSIGDAISWVQTDPMFLIFPGAALFLITLAFNLFGDGLRDALDPRSASLRR